MTNCKYLVVKGKAGLGNRMLFALTGILYARLTDRRAVIDWRDHTYSDDGSNAFPRLFDCSSCGTTDELPVTDSVAPTIWRGSLAKSVGGRRRQCRLASRLFWGY